MGTGRRGKHNRTDRRSRLSEPESSSNPVGSRSEFKESAQNPLSNPDFAAHDPDVESVSAVAKNDTENLEILRLKNQEQTEVILDKFLATDLKEDTEYVPNNKDKTLWSLVNELIDLEQKIMERKKWACEKEMKVAKKLCDEIKELKTLRMERDTNQRILQKKSTFEDDPEFKSLLDVGIDLRTAHGQVEFGHIMKRGKVVNMRMKADIAALKLSTSESVKRCVEAAKREKKHLKKYSAWEKQRDKLHEDITSEKQKLLELQKEMVQVEEAKKTAEAKWREEQEAKRRALARVKQERCLKEETMSNNKQILESLRTKMGLDFKRHRDDIQRLEQELSRVKSCSDPDHDHLTSSFGSHFEDDETIARLLQEMGDEFDETDDLIDRACVMCKQDEVSVVFLPCAHQVLCGGCNEEMEKKGEDKCPACGVLIEQRIRVFGAS